MPREKTASARSIAFYLPQYHPIPENDKWWGAGFTEWTNVAKSRPLYKGHVQPRLPADLGFYDLRVPEVREQQAALARFAGIEGFCYWHYWFGNGKRALERVFSDVLASGEPDFPFCLGWANESWTGRWHGLDTAVILEQTYPGKEDYRYHFESLLPAFNDRRYLEVDGRKIFLIYRPGLVPDLGFFLDFWNDLASRHGLSPFFFISGDSLFDHTAFPHIEGNVRGREIYRVAASTGRRGAVGVLERAMRRHGRNPARLLEFLGSQPLRRSYSEFVKAWCAQEIDENLFPCVVPNWDNTPRAGKRGFVLDGSTPVDFSKMVISEIRKIRHRPYERRLLFIKSWNEWAEGNYLEPDQYHGTQYLDVLRTCLWGNDIAL